VDQEQVLARILDWAGADPNVRLVVATGSYARGSHDALSDIDLEMYVRDPSALLDHGEWFGRFGDVLVVEALENEGCHPTRLVYYVDGKVDFMIAPTSAAEAGATFDGPFAVVLDKDDLAAHLEQAEPPGPPDEAEFARCLDWFFAAAVMCAKSLVRGDPWPAKMRDGDLKRELLLMIEWVQKVRHGWTYPTRHNGAGVLTWADGDVAGALDACWAGLSIAASADALRESVGLFDGLADEVAAALGFDASVTRPASVEVERLLGHVEVSG
jgi:aminoglycoside 6-adenylyltransferase